jgi:hypothetical protein
MGRVGLCPKGAAESVRKRLLARTSVLPHGLCGNHNVFTRNGPDHHTPKLPVRWRHLRFAPVHMNRLENLWSLLKRSIRGTYVSFEPFHLFR